MKQNNIFLKTKKLISKVKKAFKEKGVYHLVCAGAKIIYNRLINSLWYYYYKIFKSSRTFIFQGKTHGYFLHSYNTASRNERTVEIPIVWEIVKAHRGRKILEVGNVLSHYFPVNHDILDKYEKADGVINQDVIDFQPRKKYNLIVSISTLEHVGWDENPRDPSKILYAIDNLKRCLAPEGKIVLTLPLGINLEMDKLLKKGKIQFTKLYCLKRISSDNKWIETTWEETQNVQYHYAPFNANSATGVVIGIIEK